MTMNDRVYTCLADIVVRHGTHTELLYLAELIAVRLPFIAIIPSSTQSVQHQRLSTATIPDPLPVKFSSARA
jgi:hypothetical protein